MKFKVTTEFGSGRIFQSVDFEENEKTSLVKLLGQASCGELRNLVFDSNLGTRVSIPAKVLETSIIEIIE
jgi:hypothetical protein